MGNQYQIKIIHVWIISIIFASLAFLSMPSSMARAAGQVNICSETALNTALSGGGTITFGCDGTITFMSIKNITSNTVIDASGHLVTFDGGGNVRLFNIAAGVSLTLRNLTLQNAAYTSGSVVSMPYGGNLIIENSYVLNNSAISSVGGAIQADVSATAQIPAVITIRRSVFEGNQAQSNGGAIFIDGGEGGIPVTARLEISDSIFHNNQVLTNADGGAIYANYHVTTNIEGSLFMNNQAGGDAGAIFSIYPDDIVNLANTTFNTNSAGHMNTSTSGGAVVLSNANLVQNTFYNNQIVSTDPVRQGSAIYWSRSANAVVFRDNIFKSNTGGFNECNGGNWGNDNLTDDGSCNDPNGGLAITNMLTTLDSNGGPTLTHALTTGSNAIDTASSCTYASQGINTLFTNGDPITRDQRGAARPFDGDGDSQSLCDKGAYELREAITLGTCSGPEMSGTYPFAFSSGKTVTVDINTANGLNCLTLEEMSAPHLLGNRGIQITNNWWHIDGNVSSGFDIDLTLPASFVPEIGDQVCRYDGSMRTDSWNCSANDYSSATISRYHITALSDWATYEDESPTAVVLSTFQAHAGVPTIVLLLLIGTAFLAGTAILWVKKR